MMDDGRIEGEVRKEKVKTRDEEMGHGVWDTGCLEEAASFLDNARCSARVAQDGSPNHHNSRGARETTLNTLDQMSAVSNILCSLTQLNLLKYGACSPAPSTPGYYRVFMMPDADCFSARSRVWAFAWPEPGVCRRLSSLLTIITGGFTCIGLVSSALIDLYMWPWFCPSEQGNVCSMVLGYPQAEMRGPLILHRS